MKCFACGTEYSGASGAIAIEISDRYGQSGSTRKQKTVGPLCAPCVEKLIHRSVGEILAAVTKGPGHDA